MGGPGTDPSSPSLGVLTLAALTAAAFAGLSQSGIAALTTTQLAGLSATEIGGLMTQIGDLAAGLFGDRRHVADGFVEGVGALLKRLFGGLMGGRAGFLVLAGHNLSVSLLGSYSSCS